MRQTAHCVGLSIRKGLEPAVGHSVINVSSTIFEVAVYFVNTFAQTFQKELLIWHIGPVPMMSFLY
jgi:hypothetical protein